MKNKMRKIYNEITLAWNEATQQYDEVLYEDSFMYGGDMMLAGDNDLTGGCSGVEGTHAPCSVFGDGCLDWIGSLLYCEGLDPGCGGTSGYPQGVPCSAIDTAQGCNNTNGYCEWNDTDPGGEGGDPPEFPGPYGCCDQSAINYVPNAVDCSATIDACTTCCMFDDPAVIQQIISAVGPDGEPQTVTIDASQSTDPDPHPDGEDWRQNTCIWTGSDWAETDDCLRFEWFFIGCTSTEAFCNPNSETPTFPASWLELYDQADAIQSGQTSLTFTAPFVSYGITDRYMFNLRVTDPGELFQEQAIDIIINGSNHQPIVKVRGYNMELGPPDVPWQVNTTESSPFIIEDSIFSGDTITLEYRITDVDWGSHQYANIWHGQVDPGDEQNYLNYYLWEGNLLDQDGNTYGSITVSGQGIAPPSGYVDAIGFSTATAPWVDENTESRDVLFHIGIRDLPYDNEYALSADGYIRATVSHNANPYPDPGWVLRGSSATHITPGVTQVYDLYAKDTSDCPTGTTGYAGMCANCADDLTGICLDYTTVELSVVAPDWFSITSMAPTVTLTMDDDGGDWGGDLYCLNPTFESCVSDFYEHGSENEACTNISTEVQAYCPPVWTTDGDMNVGMSEDVTWTGGIEFRASTLKKYGSFGSDNGTATTYYDIVDGNFTSQGFQLTGDVGLDTISIVEVLDPGIDTHLRIPLTVQPPLDFNGQSTITINLYDVTTATEITKTVNFNVGAVADCETPPEIQIYEGQPDYIMATQAWVEDDGGQTSQATDLTGIVPIRIDERSDVSSNQFEFFVYDPDDNELIKFQSTSLPIGITLFNQSGTNMNGSADVESNEITCSSVPGVDFWFKCMFKLGFSDTAPVPGMYNIDFRVNEYAYASDLNPESPSCRPEYQGTPFDFVLPLEVTDVNDPPVISISITPDASG